jgi:hypothetical protein
VSRYKIQGGTEFEVPSAREIADEVGVAIRADVRGIKWMRLPQAAVTASGNTVSIDNSTGFSIGPEQGYAWSLRRIVISGMTTGATPDVINMYRNGITGQVPLWQFNGNNFGYTWGKLELVLSPGDVLKFQSATSYQATGATVSGELIQVPAEMLGKLAS